MSTESPRGRLAAEARERLAREAGELARRGVQPPAPGDLFVLRATGELPVEWAVLEQRGGELLAVPADASPLAGTGDVEVPAGAPGGPLVLRCRFGAWLDRKLFEPELRTGVLAEEVVAEARRCHRRSESGEPGGSPLAEEVDADPEYQDWIREVPARARELAGGAGPRRTGGTAGTPRPAEARGPRRPWRRAESLAAALAVATLGLSGYVVHLRRELKDRSVRVVGAPSEDVVLGDATRGNTVVQVPKGESEIGLRIVIDASLPRQRGYLEIVARDGKLVWRSPRWQLLPGDERILVLDRDRLPDGIYQVRIVPSPGAESVAEENLTIETSTGPAP